MENPPIIMMICSVDVDVDVAAVLCFCFGEDMRLRKWYHLLPEQIATPMIA